MSHFYGSMKGSRGEVTRQGTKSSGITAHVRGWNIGASIRCYIDSKGRDCVEMGLTGGSNANSATLENAPQSWYAVALNPNGTIERL